MAYKITLRPLMQRAHKRHLNVTLTTEEKKTTVFIFTFSLTIQIASDTFFWPQIIISNKILTRRSHSFRYISRLRSSQRKMTEVKETVSDSQRPDFIYGGPFIKKPNAAPLLDTATPRNVQLNPMFTRSFAFFTMKERIPIILTKVIDGMSRRTADYNGASPGDLTAAIEYCAKLKNDIVTNKRMDPLQEISEEAKRWNSWIASAEQPYYFTSVWVFAECYVYRRLREAFEIYPSLKSCDPFQTQKQEAFRTNQQSMCIVARKLNDMVQNENHKENISTLLKLALWANKCDLSLKPDGAEIVQDPLENITAWKSYLLVDDTAKISEFIVSKSNALHKKVNDTNMANIKCDCNRLAAARGMRTYEPEKKEESKESPEEEEPQPPEVKKPCTAKATVPSCVMFDIVCDNSGYELYTDLCIATYLIQKNIVNKVRFHVKAIPWFVSDVTRIDFQYVIDASAASDFSMEIPRKEGEEEKPSDYVSDGTPLDKDPAKFITAKHVQTLGRQWQAWFDDGTFLVESDTFWTSPIIYRDMKKMDDQLYRKLQFAVFILFKGDLNYRKLVGETNWNPSATFESCLQGFHPAPLAAIRTVKADLICGLPKGKGEQLNALDDKWMEKGDYGVIQLCGKKEDLKVSDKPCPDFGDKCKGVCVD